MPLEEKNYSLMLTESITITNIQSIEKGKEKNLKLAEVAEDGHFQLILLAPGTLLNGSSPSGCCCNARGLRTRVELLVCSRVLPGQGTEALLQNNVG